MPTSKHRRHGRNRPRHRTAAPAGPGRPFPWEVEVSREWRYPHGDDWRACPECSAVFRCATCGGPVRIEHQTCPHGGVGQTEAECAACDSYAYSFE